MKNKKSNKSITIHPLYLWIDYENKRTRNAYNINRCQFVLIDKEDRLLNKHIDDEEFVNRTKKWLKEQSPKHYWVYKKSRRANYAFWKKAIPQSGEEWGNQELIKKAKEHAKKMKKQQQLAIDFTSEEKMAA